MVTQGRLPYSGSGRFNHLAPARPEPDAMVMRPQRSARAFPQASN